MRRVAVSRHPLKSTCGTGPDQLHSVYDSVDLLHRRQPGRVLDRDEHDRRTRCQLFRAVPSRETLTVSRTSAPTLFRKV